VSGGKQLKSKNAIYMTLTAVFAALYAVGVVFLAPISFQVFQVRIADALLPLAMLFGWPAIVGLSLGAFVANFFGGLGPVDIIGGAIANFIATLVAWKIGHGRRRTSVLAGIVAEIAIITFIVGPYLSYLIGMPLTIGLLGVFLGSVVAIGVLGSILFFALSSSRVASMFRSSNVFKQPSPSED
jgi:uncharacterized membrane protein